MKNKKLALLMSKLPEETRKAFAADMKSAGMGAYESVVEKYGIALTDDEKAFLMTNTMTAIGSNELAGVKGGMYEDPTCTSCNCWANEEC